MRIMLFCVKHLPEGLAHLVSALNKYYIVVSIVITVMGIFPALDFKSHTMKFVNLSLRLLLKI